MFAKMFIFLICVSNTIILAVDYCKLCKKGSHTLCRYMEGPSDKCIDYKKPEFTTSVKKYIVGIHNDIRNHIASGQETKGALGNQPPAANMNSLQWDNELAEMAQRWADQCIGLNEDIQHDECRKTERFEVGQNVLTAVTPSFEIPEIAILILNWYKQVKNVLPSDIENFSGIQRGRFLIGQYTQLVWAETRFFGCGMSVFRNHNSSSENSKFLHRLVCNYGPRGNVISSPVYEKGIPCSKCPFGKCDPMRTSLCEDEDKTNVFGKHGDNFFLENYAKYHVDIPMYLFTSMSLGYILKHNLTEFMQNLLQNMNIHFGYDDDNGHHNQQIKCSMENSTAIFGLQEILTLLSTVKQKLNFTMLKKILGNKYEVNLKPIERSSLDKELNKMANLLRRGDEFIEDNKIYQLKQGVIIVDDCKQHPRLCQYEDDESTARKIPESDEIVLPNNMIYRKLKGTWFHGRCRCNYVYRSAAGQMFVQEFVALSVVILIIK